MARVSARSDATPSEVAPSDQPKTRPVPDWLGAIRSPALRAAAERVAAAWENEWGEALDDDEFRAEFAALVRSLESDSELLEWTADTTAALVLRRRLLDLLRAELIHAWSAPGESADPEKMLAVLRAIERARNRLEPRWDQRFSGHLAAPGGMGLVVEVAHDLRSPLTSILFLSETLRKGQSGEINDVQRRQLGIIYSAALALINVVTDVVDIARDNSRLFDTAPSPFSVTETLQFVLDVVQPMAEEKGLNVWLSPPATDQRLGHPAALSRVLLNLTTNAIKFTDTGSVEIAVAAKGLSRLEFSVRDTGRGINPEVMETLYQPFRRTRARKGYYFSGSGLGLAICRRLVEAMGATLQVETDPDWGTRFYFELEMPPASPM